MEARVQIHDVARRQEKMQNFGGHILQASSDFKVQTGDPISQDRGALPSLTPQLEVSTSVVLSLITKTVICVRIWVIMVCVSQTVNQICQTEC